MLATLYIALPERGAKVTVCANHISNKASEIFSATILKIAKESRRRLPVKCQKISHSALRIHIHTLIPARYSAWYVFQHESRCPRETWEGRRKGLYDQSMFGRKKMCQLLSVKT